MTGLDFQKHVNNAALTSLIAGARFDFLAEFIWPIISEDDILMIATMQVDFLSELKYGMPVFTGTRVESLGSTSVRLGHEVAAEDGRAIQQPGHVLAGDAPVRSDIDALVAEVVSHRQKLDAPVAKASVRPGDLDDLALEISGHSVGLGRVAQAVAG